MFLEVDFFFSQKISESIHQYQFDINSLQNKFLKKKKNLKKFKKYDSVIYKQ
jgi:hypothetical protein